MVLPNPQLPGAYWREGDAQWKHVAEISYRKPELPRSKYSGQWVSGRKTGSFVTWDTISLCIKKKKNQNLQELRIGWWAELKHQQVGKHWERHFISVFAGRRHLYKLRTRMRMPQLHWLWIRDARFGRQGILGYFNKKKMFSHVRKLQNHGGDATVSSLHVVSSPLCALLGRHRGESFVQNTWQAHFAKTASGIQRAAEMKGMCISEGTVKRLLQFSGTKKNCRVFVVYS